MQEHKLLDAKIAHGEKPKGLSNPRKTSTNTLEETSHVKHNSLGDIPFSGPLVPTSTGFTWMKKHKDANSVLKPPSRAASKSLVSDTLSSSLIQQRHKLCNEGELIDFKGSDSNELIKTALMRKWGSFERHDSFDVIDMLHSRKFKLGLQSDEFLDGRSVVVLPQINFFVLILRILLFCKFNFFSFFLFDRGTTTKQVLNSRGLYH